MDHQNSTGYQQVLKVTTYNAQGQVTKTIEYTYGHDEIAQTVTTFDGTDNVTSVSTHVFGHDGHGSVRVLFDLAAAIALLYTFDAYGQLLAIHTGAADRSSRCRATRLNRFLGVKISAAGPRAWYHTTVAPPESEILV